MNLKALLPQELDQRIKTLSQKERSLLHEIILTIKEIDTRQMYLEFGYPSLFAYLVEEVGYAGGSAQRRIDAARLLREVPSVGEKIVSGEIGLGQISLIQRASRDVLQRTSSKVTAAEKQALIEQISRMDHRSSQKEVAQFFNLPVIESSRQTIQADESVRYEFTVSKELDLQIKEAQALLSHSLGSSDIVAYIAHLTHKVLKQKTSMPKDKMSVKQSKEMNSPATRPKQVAISFAAEKRFSSKTTDGTDSTATVAVEFSARTKKQILQKQQCCQYKDPKTNKICGSRWFRQIDHKQSRWANGKGTLENGQVLCAAHNRLKYRQETNVQTS